MACGWKGVGKEIGGMMSGERRMRELSPLWSIRLDGSFD